MPEVAIACCGKGVYAVPILIFFVSLGGMLPRPASILESLLDPFFNFFVELAAQSGEEQVSTQLVLAAGEAQRFEILAPFEPEILLADPGVRVLQLNRERARLDLGAAKAKLAAGEEGTDSR